MFSYLQVEWCSFCFGSTAQSMQVTGLVHSGRVLRHISHVMWKNQSSGHSSDQPAHFAVGPGFTLSAGRNPHKYIFRHKKCITDHRSWVQIQQSGCAKSTPGAMTTMLFFALHSSYFFITLTSPTQPEHCFKQSFWPVIIMIRSTLCLYHEILELKQENQHFKSDFQQFAHIS